jgi:hypothetical protein
MSNEDETTPIVGWAVVQVNAYEQREKSRAEKRYGDVMEKSAAAIAKFTRTASFEALMQAEKIFQQNDLLVYAKRPALVKSVQEGIDDFTDGEAVYRQLLENTAAYKAHKYRKKDRLSPDSGIPLDTMRKALRGQGKRLENYRANVMGNIHEQDFYSARIAMLRRAEELYDAFQRERLSDDAGA